MIEERELFKTAETRPLFWYSALDRLAANRRAADLSREETMMTQSEQSRRGHAWQKIQAAERVTQEDGVEWLEICIYCHADRRMAKSPNGRVRVLSTQPDPLPEQCLRR